MIKRKQIDLSSKYFAILDIESHKKTQVQIADELECDHSTVSKWCKESEKIKNAYESCVDSSKKKLRQAKYPYIDEALYEWLKMQHGQNTAINGQTLTTKAKHFSVLLSSVYTEYKYFNGNNGWLHRFKKK